jgi:MoaA/NifB/PqqE/SkfB family radical SAM enzyme
MLFMGGEPMIRRDLVLKAMQLFEQSQIVTNGTYGIPSVPGHLVTVSLDGPRAANDALRGEGVFDKVKESVHARDPEDGTTVMLQMAITRHNAGSIRAFVETVADWPVDGIAFTFYVPPRHDHSGLGWDDLRQRDRIIDEIVALKKTYPQITANIGALQRMRSDVAIASTGHNGENCVLKEEMLPLYIGEQGCFERTFCCYGNDVDCSRCGAYAVFNGAYHREQRARLGQPDLPQSPHLRSRRS